MAQRGGRLRNSLVESQFMDIILPNYRSAMVQCLYCNRQMAKGATRQQLHLDSSCTPYQAYVARNQPPAALEQRLTQVSIAPTARLPHNHIALLHRTAAMAVYMTNLPFSHYENPYVSAHEKAFFPQYVPPSHTLLAGPLLDEAYNTVKAEVDKQLLARDLNFFTDETANIRKERVINFCCHALPSATSTGGGFYIKAEVGVAETMNAKTQAQWLYQQFVDTTNGELSRVNCLTTDTYGLMRSVARELAGFPGMNHVFFTLCDSHGLQLLLGDIIEKPLFKEVIKDAQWIVKSFLNSHKELSILWKFMEEVYGHRQLFILTCPIRWRTTVGLISSVLKNEQALIRYARQRKPGLDERKDRNHRKIVPHLKDMNFWSNLQLVKSLLAPIHEIQYMSEAEDYLLHRVAKNWNRIRAHLYSMSKAYPKIEDFHSLPENVWEEQFLTQCTPLHVTAALLLPENWNSDVIGLTTRSAFNTIMMEFFEQYAGLSGHQGALSAMKEWLDFRSQSNGFEPNASCWKAISDPDLFWALAEKIAPHVSSLA